MVIKGSDAGKQGKVLRVDGQKVWVEKLRLVKKHAKPSETNRQGGITDMEAPISISNVLPICPKEDKPRRVRNKMKGEEKIRVCAKCGEEIRAQS
jgi:large subunit ribosomal protein L24